MLTCKKVCQNGAEFSSRAGSLSAPINTPAPQWRAARLEFQRLIRVAGADRAQFLQGQLTQDLRQVTPSRSALTGWADAQGRLRLCGQIFHWGDALWLCAPAAIAEQLVARLRMFVLRAKVTVTLSDLVLTGLLGPDQPAPLSLGGTRITADVLACAMAPDWFATRVAGDARRILLTGTADSVNTLLGELDPEALTGRDWLEADISAGLPAIGVETTERFIPQMVNLDLLGGVSFAKGCYTGQEVITRTRHLGRVKRRMFRFACDQPVALKPGEAIHAMQREAGQVVSASATAGGTEILAVTQLAELAGPLFADAGRTVALRRMNLPYSVPEAADQTPG